MAPIAVGSHFSPVMRALNLIASVLCVGCSDGTNQQAKVIREREQIKQYLIEQSSLVSNVRRLFADSKMTAYEIRDGKWAIATLSILYGRYSIGIVQHVKIDSNKKVTEEDPIDINFVEIETASETRVSYTTALSECGDRRPIDLSKEEWDKIVAANGDFASIGVCLITNRPVANAAIELRRIY